jgi:penicillin-binding protein 1A
MEPSIHLIERRERRGRRIPALAALAVITVLGATVFGLFGFLETNAAYGTALDLEEEYLCDADDFVLDFPDLSRLSTVYTSDGVLLGELTDRNSQPVPIDEIPDLVQWAVISAEDGEFYDHEGIDFRAIMRAAILNYQSGNLTGGSTITQQIVKKTFLTEERTIERKICEAVVAAELERRYTKDQILEFYLNSQFFGENAYGVKAAAREYYSKDLDELTIAEAAAMVVPIRNPTLYDMRDNTETVLERRDAVIDQMAINGFITVADAEEAKAELLVLRDPEEIEPVSPQVLIAARQELLNDQRYGLGETYSSRKVAIFGCPAEDTECEGGGGLKITVTVNQELQDEANRILRSWFRDTSGPTGAIASIDNRTGAIKVMASGLEFGTDIEAGQRPYDLATEGRRQAGSAFKPVALLAALEYGSQAGWPITLGTYWDYSSPQRIPNPGASPPVWTVYNAGGAGGGGVRSLEQATYLSTNTVYGQVSAAVGPENIVEMAHRIGIESPLNSVLSISLGVNSVSPLEMAAAYSTIANYGERVKPYLIERIEDAEGNVIYEHEVERERVLDEALVAASVRALKKVVSQGTATRANIGRPQAGKTGTAQDYRDVWFMGFIPQYTTGVWVGYPDAQIEMSNFSVWNDAEGREQYYRRAFGGTLAAPIWKQFMLSMTENLPVEDFPPEPEGTSAYFRVPLVTVPNVLGLSESGARSEILQAGLQPVFARVASLEPEGTMLSQNPAGGTRISQGRSVTVFISSGVAPVMQGGWKNLTVDELAGRFAAFNQSTGLDLSYGIVTRETNKKKLDGLVLDWSPGTGAPLSFGQRITFFVGDYVEGGGDGGDGGDGDD